MSRKVYEDNCPGCRPVMFDMRTRQQLPDWHPNMVALLKIWSAASRPERMAFHDVTCNNSRRAKDIRLSQQLMDRLQKAMNGSDPKLH